MKRFQSALKAPPKRFESASGMTGTKRSEALLKRFQSASEPALVHFCPWACNFSCIGHISWTDQRRMLCQSDILCWTGTKGKIWGGARSESMRRAEKKGGRPLAAALPASRTSVPRTIQAIPATHTLGPSVGAHGDESQEPQRGAKPGKTGAPKNRRRSLRRARRLAYLPPRRIFDLQWTRMAHTSTSEQAQGNKNTKHAYLLTTLGGATKWRRPTARHFQKMCPTAP